MKVTLTIEIPETGDNAPDDGLPSAQEVRNEVEYIFRFTDSVPWYGEVTLEQDA